MKNRFDIHLELKLRHQEYFESKLAQSVLQNPELVPAVAKVSNQIINLIKNFQSEILEIITVNSKIRNELYGHQFYGRLHTPRIHAKEILQDILKVLQKPFRDLSQTLFTHVIFIQHIIEDLLKSNPTNEHINKQKKEALVLTIFPQRLFSRENRARIDKGEPQPNTKFGITRNPVFTKKLGTNNHSSPKALDRFEANKESHYFKIIDENNMPFVAGPSGHTGSLLLGAKLYGELNREEMKEYILATFAFFAAGGNHSFHEVAIVANDAHFGYKTNDYSSCLPDSFINSDIYSELEEEFPAFLNETINAEKSAPTKSIRLKRL